MFATINYPEGKGKQFEMFRYPGGEVQVRLTKPQFLILTGEHYIDKVHIIARITDGDIMPVAQLIDAVKGATAADIVLILPYLPYSRADRRFTGGDAAGLQTFSRILNSFAGVEVVTLDVHSPKAELFIRHFTNIDPKPIIDTVIDLIEADSTVLGVMLPDAGAERYGISTDLVASKKRKLTTGQLLGFEVPPKSKFAGLTDVLIVDDICDGGGTFNGIADAMKGYGVNLYLYVTHGIFSKGFSDLGSRFKHIYTTDSFPQKAEDWPCGFYAGATIIPCMGTILDKIVDRPALYENAKDRCAVHGNLLPCINCP
jgi:ribose-phosphate pyrophosphokinase